MVLVTLSAFLVFALALAPFLAVLVLCDGGRRPNDRNSTNDGERCDQ
jgi:hypothetical protein